jgi:hypothetical protein
MTEEKVTRTELVRTAYELARDKGDAVKLSDLLRLTNAELKERIDGAKVEAKPVPVYVAPEKVLPGPTPETLAEIEKRKEELTDLDRALFHAIEPLIDAKMRDYKVDPEEFRTLATDVAYETAKKLIEERVTTTHVVEVHGEKGVATISGAHKQMPTLLEWVAMGENVYVWGPPGGGKTTAASQVAKALGLQFGYLSVNLQTPESRLVGFIAPNTTDYHRTMFRECYENGGVFLLDEVDNGADSLLTSLDGALDNKICAFPDRLVDMHPNFVCIAAANTAGRGGSIMHAGRRQQDSAFVDRFSYLEWEYDEDLETNIVRSICPDDVAFEWLKWVRAVRNYVTENDIKLVVSPRSSYRGAKALARGMSMGPEALADAVLFKGISSDVKRTVLANCPLSLSRTALSKTAAVEALAKTIEAVASPKRVTVKKATK